MAFDLGSVSAKVTADISQFKQSMITAQEHTKNLGNSIKDAGGKIQAFGAKSTALVSAPLLALGVGAVKTAADYEQLNVAFTTILGSADKAKDILADLQEFAASTPFQLSDINNSAKSLIAFGIESDKVVDTLRVVGDVASGVGIPLQDLSVIYGKARTQGTLFAEDINQLTERGIPIIAQLAEQFGVAESEVKGLVSQGKVGFSDLEQAFADMTGEGGQFYDLMNQQSLTAGGQFSNLQDQVYQLALEIGQELLPIAKDLLEAVKSLVTWFSGLDENQKKVLLTLAGLAVVIPPIIMAVGTFITVIGAAITALSTIGAAIGVVVAFMGSLALAPALIVAAIVGLIAAVGYFVLRWLGLWDEAVAIFNNFTQKAWEFITWLIDGLKSIFQDFYDWIVGGSLIPDLVRDVLAWIGKLRDDFILYIKRMIFDVIKSFLLFVSNIINNVNELYTSVTASLGNLWTNIKNLFSGGLTYLRGIMDKIKNAIMQPFNEAKEAAEKAVKRIVEKMKDLNPLQRHSPSVVDLVSRGVTALEREYARLGSIGMPTARAITGVSGAAVAAGMGINIDLRGATISDEQIARRMATQMGDEIVRRLSMNVRN